MVEFFLKLNMSLNFMNASFKWVLHSYDAAEIPHLE